MGHIAIIFISSLLMIANSDGSSLGSQFRTLFDYPSDALSVNDLDGQETEIMANVQKSSGTIPQAGTIENLRRSIPGEPDIDYPIYRTPPETEFSCQSRAMGYYADVEARCQVFRVCTNTDLTGRGFAFLCPNGTLFNQEVFVCDWYQHVDCSASENYYGKNAQLNMNISSMSDMMAMVNEMMTFPLKSNANRPVILSNVPSTQPATQRPSVVTTKFPFTVQTTKNVNQFPSQPSRPLNTFSTFTPTTKPFGNVFTAPATPFRTQATTARPNGGLGQRTITKEGDFEINTRNGSDRLNTNKQTIFTNQPIFISSLGELSTDVGSKFDINKSKIIKPDQNEVITPAPVPNERKSKEQLEQSLADSFRNRQNGEASPSSASDSNLLNGLQQILQQNPEAMSGEADLISFIQQILTRNPDLTPDQLNAILSAESEAILKILNDALKRNRNSLAGSSGKNQLLDAIQKILDKYKTGPNAVNPLNSEQVAIFSGEADLLSQTLHSIVDQFPEPRFSGEADLLQFIELLEKQNPDFTEQQLSSILASEADSILQFLNEKRQNGIPIESGEADLLQFIQQVIQKYRNNGTQQTTAQPQAQVSPLFQNQPNAFNSITDKNRPEQQQPVLIPASATARPQFLNQPGRARDSLNANSNANQTPNEENTQKPVFGIEAIESGEADLLSTVQQLLLRIPNQREPVFSGEADLIQFIELLQKQNPDLTAAQLNAIISGEASSILRILNDKAQQNQVNGFPVFSGEADLLEAIQLVINKYRGNNQTPPLPDPVHSGEGDLLESIQRLQEQISIPILSGEANLLSFIRRIQERNPELTPAQLNQIISGEKDSILRIFNDKRQRNGGFQAVESGEADLLEAIQIVIDQSKGGVSNQSTGSVPNQASPLLPGDSLSQTLQQLSQRNTIPIFSGEADLISFIERLVEQNPGFSKEQLSEIISGEADSILQILNLKAQRSNSGVVAVESGEADLLEAIQIVLEKYKDNSTVQATASQAGESDLLQTLRQIKQQTSVPLFSGEADIARFSQRLQQRNPTLSPIQLNNIISREIGPILAFLMDKRGKDQFNNFADYSGEDDLLVAVQYYVEQYAKPETGEIVPPPTSVAVQSGESDLLSALQRIQQQVPTFSGEANLIQFIELVKQRNPDFTSDQLTAIISGEADAILQILNGKKKNQSNGIAVLSGEADLLEAIQLVIQKYRSKSVPSPTLSQKTQTAPVVQQQQAVQQPQLPQQAQRPQQQPQQQPQSMPLQPGDVDLLLTIQRIRDQTSAPVASGESDLLQFVQLIKERNPDYTSEQLNTVISDDSHEVVRNVIQKTQQNQNFGQAVQSGDAHLLEAIQVVIQKHRSRGGPNQTQVVGSQVQSFLTQQSPSLPANVLPPEVLQTTPPPPLPPQAPQIQPQFQPVQSGEGDLLQTLQRIRQQTSIPIFSGEADLLQFIEIIKQSHPEFTPSQLNEILTGESNLISQILNEKAQRNQYTGVSIISGESDLLEAIQIVLQKYQGRNVPSQVNAPAVLTQTQNIPSPPQPQIAPIQPIQQIQPVQPILPVQPLPVQPSQPLQPVQPVRSELSQAIRNIEQQSTVPIFSGEADLIQFIELIKQHSPELTEDRLSAIISGEANSILQVLNDKQRLSGVSSGNADLLNAIFQVLTKYT